MDTEQFWQENKRFILTLAAGMLVFFIANALIERVYGAPIDAARTATTRATRDLSDDLYSSSDRSLAEEENAALLEGFERIVQSAAFRPRPAFHPTSEASAKSEAIFAMEGVRERLRDLASQTRTRLPDGLDLDAITTTNVDEIERRMHAMDLVERALSLALQAGVRNVRSLSIDLDPAFRSSRGMGPIEKTKVTFDVESTADAVTRWLALVETPVEDDPMRSQALPIESLEMQRVSTKEDEVQTDVTFLVLRVHEIEEEEE